MSTPPPTEMAPRVDVIRKGEPGYDARAAAAGIAKLKAGNGLLNKQPHLEEIYVNLHPLYAAKGRAAFTGQVGGLLKLLYALTGHTREAGPCQLSLETVLDLPKRVCQTALAEQPFTNDTRLGLMGLWKALDAFSPKEAHLTGLWRRVDDMHALWNHETPLPPPPPPREVMLARLTAAKCAFDALVAQREASAAEYRASGSADDLERALFLAFLVDGRFADRGEWAGLPLLAIDGRQTLADLQPRMAAIEAKPGKNGGWIAWTQALEESHRRYVTFKNSGAFGKDHGGRPVVRTLTALQHELIGCALGYGPRGPGGTSRALMTRTTVVDPAKVDVFLECARPGLTFKRMRRLSVCGHAFWEGRFDESAEAHMHSRRVHQRVYMDGLFEGPDADAADD